MFLFSVSSEDKDDPLADTSFWHSFSERDQYNAVKAGIHLKVEVLSHVQQKSAQYILPCLKPFLVLM